MKKKGKFGHSFIWCHESQGLWRINETDAHTEIPEGYPGHGMLSENQKKMGDHCIAFRGKWLSVKKSKKFLFSTHLCLINCQIKKCT